MGTQTDRYYIGIEAKFQLRRLDERPPANVYEHFTQAGARLETVKEFLDSVVALHRASVVYPGSRMTLEKLKQDWWPGNWTIAEEPHVMRNIRRWEPNKFCQCLPSSVLSMQGRFRYGPVIAWVKVNVLSAR